MLSREILKSLERYEKMLSIIEKMIYEEKEDILREIYIQLDCDYENIKKLFKTYNLINNTGVDGYIIKRKIQKTILDIYNIKDINIQNKKITSIMGVDREVFSRMIKQRYNFTLKEVLDNEALLLNLQQPIDIEEVKNMHNEVENSLKKLGDLGIWDYKLKRRKVELSNININMMVYTLLTQEGYIYYSYNSNEERFNYIFSLLANNLLLNQWNLIKEKHKNFKTTTFLEYIYNDKEIKNWLIKEALSLYDKETLHISFLCNGISYYIVPKEELRGYIEEFNLPNKVTSYISVLSKCKAFIESICLHNININTCKDAVEIFYKTKQKLLVKSQFDIDYNYMLAIQEISKKLSSIEKEVFYFIIYIEENFNNEITIDDGYKFIKKKYKDLSKEEYEKAIKELLLKGYIWLKGEGDIIHEN